MELHTERLLLREFTADDAEPMHAWQTDPRYLEHYPVTHVSWYETRDLVKRFLAWQAEQPRCRRQLAICLRGTGELIGCAGVRCASEGAATADVGFELDPDHWRFGYGTEAMGCLVTFAFDELGLDELTARTVAANVRALRLLEHLGFRPVRTIPAGPEGDEGDDRHWPERVECRLTRRDRQAGR